MEFFSRDDKRLGDKRTLKQQIHEITGIPSSALEEASLSQTGVDERLSWAENRQTTRGEDKAYSLLGMFGIYLPPIYGEGREHAFKWLKKEIQISLTGNYMINCFLVGHMLINFLQQDDQSHSTNRVKAVYRTYG